MFYTVVRHGQGSQVSDWYAIGDACASLALAKSTADKYTRENPERDGWHRYVEVLNAPPSCPDAEVVHVSR